MITDSLHSTFSGDIIQPADPAYQEARTVLFTQGSPSIILRPKTAQDVVVAIGFARQNTLPIAVRSGGHSGPGFGTNVDGAVIDLVHLNTVDVIDAEKNIVRIGAGARWVDVATTLKEHGLALSSGDTKSVGVGGLTLGGGIGWLVRKVGLTIDSLIAAEVVTAQGQILRASSSEHQDLFWAIRGGGGNFGVVTSFEFTAFPLSTVIAGPISYSIDEVEAVLKGWRDAMRTAPDELSSTAVVLPSFGTNPAGVMIMTCFAGDDETVAQQAIQPLKNLGKVVFSDVKKKAYADVLEDAHPPQGVDIITKVLFVKDFSDACIQTIATQCKTKIPIIQIRYLGGAMKKIAPDATAFAHRDSEILMVSPVFVPHGAPADTLTQASAYWNDFVPFGQGTYANLLSTATTEDVHAMYPEETYKRLAEIKKTYDPDNMLKGNWNIVPVQ